MQAPSLLRLNLLRLCYGLLVVGLAIQVWPLLLGAVTERSAASAVVVAMLSALALVSILGLIAPLRMLPVLLWEIAWKTIWALSVALPKWRAGELDSETAANLFAVSFAIPFLLIFPWRWFAADIAANRNRWRRAVARSGPLPSDGRGGPAAGAG